MFENEARTSNSNHATMETEGLHNNLMKSCYVFDAVTSIRSVIDRLQDHPRVIQLHSRSTQNQERNLSLPT